MSVIYGVLKEEREHILSALPLYVNEVADLPHGSLWVKTRGKRRYAYLAYREKNKVKFDYVGPIPSRKYDLVLAQVKEKMNLLASIKRMKTDIRIIERSLQYAERIQRTA